MRSCAAAGGGGDAGDAGDAGDGGSDGGSDVLRGDDTQIWNAEEAGEGVMELSVNGRCLRPYQLGSARLVAAGDAVSSKAEREASYDASAPCIGFERVPVLADEASEPVVDGKPKPLECGRGIPC